MGEAAPQPRLRRRASAAGARRLRQGQAAPIADPQEGPRPSQPDPARPHAPEDCGAASPTSKKASRRGDTGEQTPHRREAVLNTVLRTVFNRKELGGSPKIRR